MLENTLTVGRISEGFVLDHIEAGKSMEIYKYLHLDKLDCCVAIIKNAKSNKMGKKDIMKIECPCFVSCVTRIHVSVYRDDRWNWCGLFCRICMADRI